MMPGKIAFLVAILLSVASCLVPLPPAPNQVRKRIAVYKQIRVGVLDFGSLYGERGDYTKAVPAILTAELRKIDRFSVHDTAGLDLSKGHIDMYVNGAIISYTVNVVCMEIRMSNSVSHDILYNARHCISTQDPERRRGILAIAEEISKSVDKQQIGHAKVISADGESIFISKGTDSGIKRGMLADLVPDSEHLLRDRDGSLLYQNVISYTGMSDKIAEIRELPGVDLSIVVGTLYVVSAEAAFSIGLLIRGDYAKPGDRVVFR